MEEEFLPSPRCTLGEETETRSESASLRLTEAGEPRRRKEGLEEGGAL